MSAASRRRNSRPWLPGGIEDRDRIAQDLHDLVIQRLFANGMKLQGALPLIDRLRRSGLANLTRRAGQHGGTLTAGPAEAGGTELRWQVPLSPARP